MSAVRTTRPAPAQRRSSRDEVLPAPLVWTFDGPIARCLTDAEQALGRAIVMVGDASRVAIGIDLSLPALQSRIDAGDRLQPGWQRFRARLAGYGLPLPPRIRFLRDVAPLATLIVAYRR